MTKHVHTHLSRVIDPWFEEAFALHALGERVTWEVVFVMLQTPDGQVIPCFQLFSMIPGVSLGTAHMDLAQIGALGIDEKRVSEEVRGAVDRMLNARSQSLAQANGGGKLILP
jgi:hypothetical protein